MEFTIDRAELLAGLYLTQGIVEKRTTVPILGNALFSSIDGGVAIAATDQELTVRRQCTATIQASGRLTTGTRKLYEMIRELPDGEVRIRSLENNWIEVFSGKSRFRLVGMNPDEFPEMNEPPENAQPVTLAGEMLAGMIEYTVFAMCSDEARPGMNGLYLESTDDGQLRGVTTDGHRLAMVTRPVEGTGLTEPVILPRKAVMELRKILESGEDQLALVVASGVAHIQRGPVQMSTRLIEGDFPDYNQVVPSGSSCLAVMDIAPFLAALRRVSVVSSERTRGVKLQIEKGRMLLSSINPDVGEAADELDIEYEGEPLNVGFNARYLIDILSVLPGGSRVELGFNSEDSPGVLREIGDPNYCYIVMPMRL